ncbi:hypothetical protein B0H13DRAFT_2332016 [Mycena leptocephala]|nr:hypothetical protein B0H13DRAFT_2332016 [Mycena leptocephala]
MSYSPSASNDAQNTQVPHVFLVARWEDEFAGVFALELNALPSAPNDAQNTQVLHVFLVARWEDEFAGVFALEHDVLPSASNDAQNTQVPHVLLVARWEDEFAGVFALELNALPSTPNDAQNTQVLHVFLVARWVDEFAGVFALELNALPSTTPNDAQKTQALEVFFIGRWVDEFGGVFAPELNVLWGDFGGVLHWNSMYVSFRTQRRVKASSPSYLFGRSLARWVWQGFALELDLSILPHPTTRKTLKSFMSFWSLDGWGDFGGVLHWNLMSGSFRTQRDAKLSSSSPFCYRLPGGSVWRGFSTGTQCLKPIARVLPHPTTHKRVKFLMSVWSLDGSTTTKMGRTKNKSTQEQTGSTAAERKKQAWTTYYEQNADTIREKRRLQMAEKRALLKAKRRASDKPRPKKEPKKETLDRGHSVVGPDNEQQQDPGLPDGDVGGPSVDVAHDNEDARILADAEREASETLAGMWQTGLLERPKLLSRNSIAPESPFHNWRNAEAIEEAFGEEVGSDDDVGSDDEHEPGVRSISEVAHEAANHWEVDIDQDAESSGDSRQRQKLRFMTPTGSPSPSPSPEPQWRMPSFIDYLDDYMHCRRM